MAWSKLGRTGPQRHWQSWTTGSAQQGFSKWALGAPLLIWSVSCWMPVRMTGKAELGQQHLSWTQITLQCKNPAPSSYILHSLSMETNPTISHFHTTNYFHVFCEPTRGEFLCLLTPQSCLQLLWFPSKIEIIILASLQYVFPTANKNARHSLKGFWAFTMQRHPFSRYEPCIS